MGHLDKDHRDLSHAKKCDLLSVSRSSTYYKASPVSGKTVDLLNEIREIWEKHPFYGYRRIHAVLGREGLKINRKRVHRLMMVAGLRAIYPGPKTSQKGKENRKYPYLLKERTLTAPNQVWATDITYLKVPQGSVYLMALIDVHSRYILSWRLSNSLSLSFCLEALGEALERHGPPDILNTDQGSQFTSDDWVYSLLNWGIQPSMTGVGRCLDNIHCERFWRTLKYENAYLYGYENMKDARGKIDAFIKFYNHERPHQSLGYKVPADVYKGRHLEKWPEEYVDHSLNLKIERPTHLQTWYTNPKKETQISLI